MSDEKYLNRGGPCDNFSSITGNSVRYLNSFSISSCSKWKSLLLLCSYSVQAFFCRLKIRLASIAKMFAYLGSPVFQRLFLGLGRKDMGEVLEAP